MKILFRDEKHGRIKLQLETMDDLWHLYQLLDKGDVVAAMSYRLFETALFTDKLRPEKGKKRKVLLGIRVEKQEFQEFSDRLRVHGMIVEGQDIGQYHTLNLEPGDVVTITKECWRADQLKRLADAVKETRKPLITVISLDEDEATLAILHSYGVQHITTLQAHRSGKAFQSKDDVQKTEFFDNIILHLAQSHRSGPVLIIGPGFTKERFYMYGKEHAPAHFADATVQATAHAGMVGVQEILKSGQNISVLRNSRVREETELVEKLLMEIAKDGLYAYGAPEVEKAVDTGAVEILLLLDKHARDERNFSLMTRAEATRCRLVIISSAHEAGKKLAALGGMGALLRYRMEHK